MATKTLEQIAQHSKTAWGVSKLLTRLANNVFSQMRIKRSYEKKITALEQERDTELAIKIEKEQSIVNEMMLALGGPEGAFVKGLRSVTYAVGQVGFRQMKPSVEIAEGFTKQDVVSRFLKRRRAYLRIKHEINKQKILQDYQDGKWKTLTGITITQGDEFFVSLAPRGDDKPEVISVPIMKK